MYDDVTYDTEPFYENGEILSDRLSLLKQIYD